ncbi:MAG: hypothetical protein DRN12_05690 [Thermoplasmata archaeon]|nr:MAG: hypothetical protein DRN12_05690 [Thermoplasmata archaeon]
MSRDAIETGIKNLDKLLGGGVQKGFTICITGVPGTNMEIIMKQIASKGDVVFITTGENKEDVLKIMKKFGWNNKHLVFIDIAQIYLKYIQEGISLRSPRVEERSKNQIKELIKLASSSVPSRETKEPDFLDMFISTIQRFSSKKIVLDSLDFFLKKYSWIKLLEILNVAKINIIEGEGLFFFNITRGIHGKNIERELEQLADCVIELDVIRSGNSFERILSIKKFRNHPENIQSARYDIGNEGVTLESIERI